MHRLMILIAVLALAVAACEGETAETDPETTASPEATATETTPATDETEVADEDPQQRLNDAADNTVDAGSASYEVSFGDRSGAAGTDTGSTTDAATPEPTATGTEAPTPDATPTDEATPGPQTTDEPTTEATPETDATTSTDDDFASQSAAQGEVSFEDGVRRVMVDDGTGQTSDVIIEGSTVYVPLDGTAPIGGTDDADTEDSQWGTFDLGDLTSDDQATADAAALLVYEDPESVIDLVRDAEDATSGAAAGASGASYTLTVQADQAGGDLLSLWADQGVDTLDVEVWLDDQDMIERIALTPQGMATTENATPDVATTENATPDVTTTEDATPDVSTTENATPDVTTTENATPDVTTTENATPDVTTTDDPTPGTTAGAEQTVTWEFTAVGTAVDVQVPDDAVDLEADEARSALPQPSTTGMTGTTENGIGTSGGDRDLDTGTDVEGTGDADAATDDATPGADATPDIDTDTDTDS